MKLKTLLTTAVSTVLGAAIILPTQASDGTISFTGSVTDTTCNISVNGSGTANGTVALPVARLDHLTAIGNTAGDTNFNVVLSGCTGANANGQGVAVHFERGAHVNANGRLTTTGTATGLELALYPQGNTAALVLGQAPAAATGTIAGNGLTLAYTAKYLSTSVAPTAGTANSSVTYSLVYF